MEITGKPPSNGISGYVQNVRDDKTDANRPEDRGAPETGDDRVRLSNGAREVREAIQVMNELPDVRSEKVTELKAQIEQGTYQPDGRRIAFHLLKQSLLDEMG